MQLRPYQQEAKDAILNEWDKGIQRTLLVLPTGTGKTIVFCKLVEELVRRGKRCLIMAHRGELLDQAADKLQKSTGLGCAVEKAELSALGEWYRVTVGSVQTLMRKKRLRQFPPDFYDVIIVDEAHHCLANSYQKVFEHFSGADVLGVTATPDRGDMRELGIFFESLAYSYSLPQAIKDGFLTPIRAQTIPLRLDISGVGVSGDFKVGELGSALDPYLERIADEMTHYCADRKTVVFLPLVATSQKMRDFLNAKGFRAAEVNGESKDRAEILADFEAGRYNVLCNSMLLTEGWDSPAVDCVIPLRPTKVRSLYCQMIGRGTRLSPETGKTHLLLLDFLWHTDRHELSRPAHLIADSEEVAAKMTENIAEAGCAVDLEEEMVQGESDCVAEREEALAKQLEKMKKRKRNLVDPLQYAMSIQSQDLTNYEPAFGWEQAAPTDQQKKSLEGAGIFPDEIKSAGEAELIIKSIEKRRDSGLATAKQIRLLEKMNFQHVGAWTFEGANNMISRIAANNWRPPHGVNAKEYQPTR